MGATLNAANRCTYFSVVPWGCARGASWDREDPERPRRHEVEHRRPVAEQRVGVADPRPVDPSGSTRENGMRGVPDVGGRRFEQRGARAIRRIGRDPVPVTAGARRGRGARAAVKYRLGTRRSRAGRHSRRPDPRRAGRPARVRRAPRGSRFNDRLFIDEVVRRVPAVRADPGRQPLPGQQLVHGDPGEPCHP